MKQNHFECSTPRHTYQPFRFEDSLRKYQHPPTKKIKCCNIVNHCKRHCQKNHNISQQQRLLRIDSARKLYSSSKIIERNKQNIHNVSEFTDHLLLGKQLFKDELDSSIMKPLLQGDQIIVKFAEISRSIEIFLHDLEIQQKKNQALSPKRYQSENQQFQKNCFNIQQKQERFFNQAINHLEEQYSRQESRLNQNTLKDQYSIGNLKDFEQSNSYAKHNDMQKSQEYDQFEKENRQENLIRIKQIDKKYKEIKYDSFANFSIQCTLEKNFQEQILESFESQKLKNQQQQLSKPKAKNSRLAKQLQILSIQPLGHFRISVENLPSQCLISIRVLNKLKKRLPNIKDMVSFIIQERPYLKPAQMQLQQLIKNNFQ